MFCSKCGAQIPDGASFCSSCGAPTAAPAAEARMPSQPAPASSGTKITLPANLSLKKPDFSDQKTLFKAAACGVLLLALIFACIKVIGVSYSMFGVSDKEYTSLGSAERGGFTALVIIFALFGMIACAASVLVDWDEKLGMIIDLAAPGCAFLGLLFFLIGFWSAKGEVAAYGDWGIKCFLSFGGWLCLIFFLGAIALSGFHAFNKYVLKKQ